MRMMACVVVPGSARKQRSRPVRRLFSSFSSLWAGWSVAITLFICHFAAAQTDRAVSSRLIYFVLALLSPFFSLLFFPFYTHSDASPFLPPSPYLVPRIQHVASLPEEHHSAHKSSQTALIRFHLLSRAWVQNRSTVWLAWYISAPAQWAGERIATGTVMMGVLIVLATLSARRRIDFLSFVLSFSLPSTLLPAHDSGNGRLDVW